MKRIVGGARGYCVGMRMERSQLPPGVLLVSRLVSLGLCVYVCVGSV